MPQTPARTSAGSRPGAAQLADVRRRNYATVLRAVMHAGRIARTDLAAVTGMTGGTVTKLVAGLASAGLVEEDRDSQPAPGMGRPKVPLAVDSSVHGVIGVHVGLLRTLVCLLDLRGGLVDEVELTHRGRDLESVVDQIASALPRMAARSPRRVIGLGASTGGRVDAVTGVVLDHPSLGWRDEPLRQALADRLGLPVAIDSHFQALALAEHWLGSASAVDDLVHLFVGNVVGAGLVVRGRSYRGSRSTAGGLLHFPTDETSEATCECGRRTCLPLVASDLEVVRRARRAGLLDGGDVRDVMALAEAGSLTAQGILRDRARTVGDAAAALVELLDPQLLVISGGVSDTASSMETVRDQAARRLGEGTRVIRSSAFGSHAVGIAAGAVMLDQVYRDPLGYVGETEPPDIVANTN